MKKRTLPLIGFFILSLSFMYGQNPELDSLKNVLTETAQDTNRLSVLMALSGKYYRVNPDSGIVYSQKAINLARNLDRKTDLGFALKNMGLAYYFQSNFPEALKYWEASLATFKTINHIQGISNLVNNLGAVHYSKGNDPTALEYYLESLKFAEEINDEDRIATAYNNIGAVYANDEMTYDQARDSYAKAIEISERTGKKDAIGTAALNIGQLYVKEGKPEEALAYFERGLEAFREIGGNIATSLNNLGGAYTAQGKYTNAVQYHRDALENAKSRDSKIEIAQAYLGLGNALLGLERYDAAISAYTNSTNVAEEIAANNEKRDSYEGLAQAYAEKGDFKNAFEYHTDWTKLKDEMRSQENETTISNLRFTHDLENKEKEIKILNQDVELKAAQIERDSNLQKLSLAIGAFLLLGIAGIYYQFRYTKKTNALLAKERNKAEEILLNILPKDTADELKAKGHVDAREYDHTTVLFTDFKGFTNISETVPADELVKSIDYYFKKFDAIIEKYGLEKIKTIGDSYMCAGGLPTKNSTNSLDAVRASVEIMEFVKATHKNPPNGIYPFEVRIGINTGPLIAGVVGTKKFQYDIWGSTVNIASRMESNSEAGKINISQSTYDQIKDYFECKYRGEIEVKNAGKQKMYFVENRLPKLAMA